MWCGPRGFHGIASDLSGSSARKLILRAVWLRCPYCHSQLCPDRAIGDDCRVDCGREPHDIDECAQRIHGAVCGCATGVDNHTRLLTVLRVPPGRGVQLRLG